MFTRPQNKLERLQLRQAFIPKGARLVPGPKGGAAYAYELGGKFYAIVFRGSAARPDFHYSYGTAAHRDDVIAKFHEGLQHAAAYRAKRASEKAAWVNPLKVGDILHSSWGYDQTNVEFYAVTKVSGRRVWIRMICSDYEETGFMSGKTWPAMPIRFVEEKPVREDADAWTRLLNGHESMHIAQPSGEKGASVKVSDSIYAWMETGREHYTSSYA